MSEKIVVPALGESVTEATVSKWLKGVGDKFDLDEPIVELETDKVNVEVPSPSNGVLQNISVNEGEIIGIIGANGVENIIDIKLNDDEKHLLRKSAKKVNEMNSSLSNIIQ